jgi:cell division protein ZapA
MQPGSADTKTVRVTISNQTFTLGTTGDPAELEAAALAVDDRIRAIAARAGNMDQNRIALLACLHFADEVRVLERELDTLRSRIDSKTREFSTMLDKVFE